MKSRRIFIIALIIISALCIAAACLSQRESATIGIIGGADGPTAIFVTASPHLLCWLAAILIIAILAICTFIYLKRKAK